jgi:hypothetical protein
MAGIPTRKPVTRRISARALVIALEGPERAYPVYQFSDRNFYERPRHNPFAHMTDPDLRVTEESDNRFTEDSDQRVLEQP